MKELGKRIYDLIIKLLSVKGVFAILMTVFALMKLIDGYFCFLAWTLFIVGREAFKMFGNKS